LVSRVEDEHWTYAETAEAFGVSERTVGKWVQRCRQGGVAALDDGSSRPGPPTHQTPALAVYLIGWLREQHGLPAWAMALALRMPRSTVSRWRQRLGLNRPVAAPVAPVQRYEWPHAGDLLHLDIKPLGKIDGLGHRIHGDRRRRAPGVGWEYVHVAVDDHSRMAYVEVLTDQLGPTCAAFLERAVAWFATRGITIRRVLTDTAAATSRGCFMRRPTDSRSRTTARGRIGPAPTGKRSGLSRRSCASGRTWWRMPRRVNAATDCDGIWPSTTASARMLA
jgi:transposase